MIRRLCTMPDTQPGGSQQPPTSSYHIIMENNRVLGWMLTAGMGKPTEPSRSFGMWRCPTMPDCPRNRATADCCLSVAGRPPREYKRKGLLLEGDSLGSVHGRTTLSGSEKGEWSVEKVPKQPDNVQHSQNIEIRHDPVRRRSPSDPTGERAAIGALNRAAALHLTR